ncbi:MAG: glycosyltransferase [Desulfococcaceae bacterium]
MTSKKNMHSKSVSVIIPAYNRSLMLREAVDSVLNQDYPDFEIIVVDDGSADDTPEMLASYGDKITVIRQPNRGVSAARNRGIAAAKGELIAFLDSDDLWLPGKLTKQAEFFHAHPEALICQTEEIWIRRGKRVNPKNRHKKLSGLIFEPSLHLCLVSPSAVMMRGSLFEKVGLFDENLPACEDYDLWLRISRQYPVFLMDTPLIVKRGGHADQLSAAPGLDQYRIASIRKLLDSGDLTEDQRVAAIAVLKEKCAIYAAGCLKRGKVDEAGYFRKLAEMYSSECGTDEKP